MARVYPFFQGWEEGVQRNQSQEAAGPPLPPSALRAALLKGREEEALPFKGLLKLGKTSNKEISCHMRVAGKNRNSKLQLCFVSELLRRADREEGENGTHVGEAEEEGEAKGRRERGGASWQREAEVKQLGTWQPLPWACGGHTGAIITWLDRRLPQESF